MKDDELENLMRSLKPAPLPSDLKARLSPEPMRPRPKQGRWKVFLTAAATFAIALFSWSVFNDRDSPTADSTFETPNSPAPVPNLPVSVLKTDSTLLNSRTLAIKKIDGELWEVAEEEWRDDTLALCSAGPVKLNSTVIRREIVCSPVQFY